MNNSTILYVDDEETNLELFKANFEDKFNLFTAHSGIKGLEILKERSEINIVVSDLKMPRMDGFEFIKELKKVSPNTICIVLSAFLLSDFPEDSIDKKDVFRYLNKPWRRNEMDKIIMDAINAYENVPNN